MSATQICTKMTTPPPPSPCTARPPTSIAAFLLTPHRILPNRKITIATMEMGFRPNTSERRPQNGTDAALTKRYADPVHAYSELGRWKSSDTVGRAVGNSVVSRATRNTHVVSAAKENRTRRDVFAEGSAGGGDGDVVVEVMIDAAVDEEGMVAVESCLFWAREEEDTEGEDGRVNGSFRLDDGEERAESEEAMVPVYWRKGNRKTKQLLTRTAILFPKADA